MRSSRHDAASLAYVIDGLIIVRQLRPVQVGRAICENERSLVGRDPFERSLRNPVMRPIIRIVGVS